MKRQNLILLAFLIAAASCTSYKKVPYLQNSSSVDPATVVELYDAKIQPKDMLTITVSSEDLEAAIPFNLTVGTLQTAARYVTSQPVLQTYLVDNEGYIEFPTLGRLHVGGLTKNEVESIIKEKLTPNFTNAPIVNVRMVNYKISIIGEVVRPNTYTISNEKVNVFEALALAGDLTIYGRRDGVKLIRENADGTKQIVPLNLNDANLIYSPYYYLQQNDVLYVEPNKAKAQNSDIGSMTSLWFSGTSILISLVSLLYNILN
ncbi:MAG: polysaccharide biosynthesis/export family protein [Bacteroidaceae bacterium]|jgi:polysaccharide export outer membrane protein|nr:polysaccharide biosynthesis/export family protein [Bacteroidaceae bacterium]